MEVKEFKRELSKLSGIDFFNPKYRELFKKAFPEEEPVEDEPKETEADGKEEKIEGTAEKAEKEEQVEKDVDVTEEDGAESDEDCEEAEDEEEEAVNSGSDDEPKADKLTNELLAAKIENALLRRGVREERISSAMRLAKSEITCLDDLDKIEDILRDFPEWLRGYKPQGFGMDLDNGSDNLTEEEKRLKAMGIDPKN